MMESIIGQQIVSSIAQLDASSYVPERKESVERRHQRWLLALIGLLFTLSGLTLAAPVHAASRSPRVAYGLGDQNTDVAPALVPSPDGKSLYAVWKVANNANNDGDISIMVGEGTPLNWGTNPVLLNQKSDNGISAAFFENRLYIAYTATDGSNSIHLGYYQPNQADLQNDITLVGATKNSSTVMKPAIADFNNQLYVAWVDKDEPYIHVEVSQPHTTNFTQFNVAEFKNNETILSATAHSGPALTVYNNQQLYLTYPGTDSQIYLDPLGFDGNHHIVAQSNVGVHQWTTRDVAITAAAPGSLVLGFVSNNGTDQILISSSTSGAGGFKSASPPQSGGTIQDSSGASVALANYNNSVYALWPDGRNGNALNLAIVYSPQTPTSTQTPTPTSTQTPTPTSTQTSPISPQPTTTSTAVGYKTNCNSTPSAANCDNQGPLIQVCDVTDGLTTPVSLKAPLDTLGTIEIRHSQECQSVWVRITGINMSGLSQVNIQFDANGKTETAGYSGGNGGTVFTGMIYVGGDTSLAHYSIKVSAMSSADGSIATQTISQ